jgi:hypothetical protein
LLALVVPVVELGQISQRVQALPVKVLAAVRLLTAPLMVAVVVALVLLVATEATILVEMEVPVSHPQLLALLLAELVAVVLLLLALEGLLVQLVMAVAPVDEIW